MKARGGREQFARMLVSIGHAVARLEREQVCCGELTFQQFATLRRIEQNSLDTVSAVAGTMGIDESTASRNISLLVRNGYLTKGRHPGDGRTLLLRLTPRARMALASLSCDERDVFGTVFDRLPAGVRAACLDTLAAVDQALAEGGDGSCCKRSA